MKNAASRLRQKTSCSVRSWCRGRSSLRLLLVDEVEVDLLERRPAHLERVELFAAGERFAGQLVEDARRLGRPDDDVLAARAVADLDLEIRAS